MGLDAHRDAVVHPAIDLEREAVLLLDLALALREPERAVGVSSRLRDETDPESLDADIISLVQHTLQPAHVSLWLRGMAERTGRKSET